MPAIILITIMHTGMAGANTGSGVKTCMFIKNKISTATAGAIILDLAMKLIQVLIKRAERHPDVEEDHHNRYSRHS